MPTDAGAEGGAFSGGAGGASPSWRAMVGVRWTCPGTTRRASPGANPTAPTTSGSGLPAARSAASVAAAIAPTEPGEASGTRVRTPVVRSVTSRVEKRKAPGPEPGPGGTSTDTSSPTGSSSGPALVGVLVIGVLSRCGPRAVVGRAGTAAVEVVERSDQGPREAPPST